MLTFSHPRKMSFDMASIAILDDFNAIYLHFRSIFEQINALTTTTKNIIKTLIWAICTNSMDLLHDLNHLIVQLVLKMDDLHKGALACSHGWKCIFLWSIKCEPQFPELKWRFTYLIRAGIAVCLATDLDVIWVTGSTQIIAIKWI